MAELMDAEVTALVGPKGRHDADRAATRHERAVGSSRPRPTSPRRHGLTYDAPEHGGHSPKSHDTPDILTPTPQNAAVPSRH